MIQNDTINNEDPKNILLLTTEFTSNWYEFITYLYSSIQLINLLEDSEISEMFLCAENQKLLTKIDSENITSTLNCLQNECFNLSKELNKVLGEDSLFLICRKYIDNNNKKLKDLSNFLLGIYEFFNKFYSHTIYNKNLYPFYEDNLIEYDKNKDYLNQEQFMQFFANYSSIWGPPLNLLPIIWNPLLNSKKIDKNLPLEEFLDIFMKYVVELAGNQYIESAHIDPENLSSSISIFKGKMKHLAYETLVLSRYFENFGCGSNLKNKIEEYRRKPNKKGEDFIDLINTITSECINASSNLLGKNDSSTQKENPIKFDQIFLN